MNIRGATFKKLLYPTVFAMAAVVQDVQEVAVAAFSQVSCVPAEFTPGNDMFAVPSKLTPHRNISAAGRRKVEEA